MKGVILAGGLGTRLRPLTYVTNKHLLPVYDQPMIFYPIQTLIKAGIDDVVIVTGENHDKDFLRVFNNHDFGLKNFDFAYQKGEGGIAQALSLVEDQVKGESVAVILGDNTTDADIRKEVKSFDGGALIFLKAVSDPERFGVATVEGNKITKIAEKPSQPESNLAVTGLYLYDNTVFDRIRQLKPSARGELEITDVNNSYLKEERLSWADLPGHWTDAGTPESLLEAGIYWRKVRRGKER